MKFKIFSLLVLLFISSQLFSNDDKLLLFDQKPVQALVQDYAHFLTEAQDRKIEKKLNDLNRSTSTQILFITVKDLMGYSKNDYISRLVEEWSFGGEEDNGIVILVQPETDQSKGEVSIQIGHALKSLIPDIVAKRIIEHEVIPNFENGKHFRGIDAAINVLISIRLGEFSSSKYLERNGGQPENHWLPFILFIIISTLLFIILKMRNARHYSIGHNVSFWLTLCMTDSSKHTGGGFSNFSSGSGSFGGRGFEGFGGGGFGGGGAGGSW